MRLLAGRQARRNEGKEELKGSDRGLAKVLVRVIPRSRKSRHLLGSQRNGLLLITVFF